MKKSVFVLLFVLILFLLYYFEVIPHVRYTNEFFHFSTYDSDFDADQDGIDDQTDILNGALQYIKTRPKYKSKYYSTGYPDDEYGTCVDVVNFALLNAGYDIQKLLYEDVLLNPEVYEIEIIDKNIDFRRVLNLNTYLKRHAISLTTDLKEYEMWQGGDIVVFESHIGIISSARNRKKIPFLIHHSRPNQLYYEEDVLEKQGKIIGHYRMS